MKNSCGILLYNDFGNELKVFLVHPGGPFFTNKDEGYWSVPKGIAEVGEDFLLAAKREFLEETSLVADGEYFSLGSVQQNKNKIVHAWALRSNLENPIKIESNRFDFEYPFKSGKFINIPEVDKGEFFNIETARKKMNPAQTTFLDRLVELLGG